MSRFPKKNLDRPNLWTLKNIAGVLKNIFDLKAILGTSCQRSSKVCGVGCCGDVVC